VIIIRRFWTGNIASAEGALRAGCNFYAGYPITPSSDLMEYMARELPKRGGVFIQGEDEIASINMLIGASIAGAKAMTATSGPGFSLMQEGIGLAVMLEAPLVIVDVMRLGPATGQATKSGQGDLMQSRWGRHGDQVLVVYAPSSVKEAFLLTIKAFNTAESLRTPVVVLLDELIGHLWEVIDVPEDIEVVERVWSIEPGAFFDSEVPENPPPMPKLGVGLNVLYTGSTHDGYGFRKTQDPDAHNKLVRRIHRKIYGNLDRIFIYDYHGEDAPDILFITFGSVSRPTTEAVDILNSDGYRVGILKLMTLWPIDYTVLKSFVDKSQIVIVPEMNLGQLIHDVKMVGGDKVYRFNKIGGGIPIYSSELVGYVKEVYK